MDLAMADVRTGYAALGTGQVVRLDIPDDPAAPIAATVVLDGLVNPRGAAIRDGILLVVELGPFPCDDPVGLCEGPVLDAGHPEAGEITILEAMRARVLAYPLQADGSLGPPTEALTDIPVVNAYHAVNGLTLGPDGHLYLAVGNVDRLWYMPDAALDTTPHPEWLGTILRLGAPGTPPEVFASGLRNVYDITFDGAGRMWAVDNDGPTPNGFRFEEVLRIQQHHDYGYPVSGTFLGPRERDDGATWISDTVGTAGIGWAGDVGLDPGLLIGDCTGLSHLGRAGGTTSDDGWERALNPGDQRPLAEIPSCLTSLAPIGDGELLAGGRGPDGLGVLYRIGFSPSAPAS
jgi:hypothetical protein